MTFVAASRVWQVYGLYIASPWPLSTVPVGGEVVADLTIVLGERRVAPEGDLPGRVVGTARRGGELLEATYDDGGAVSLLVPGFLVATFDAQRRSVVVYPDPDARTDAVRRFVATAVVATWMILGDMPVLHASAAQVGDGAVLFMGNSGSGKSTMSAALVGAGGRAISDDVCRLAQVDDRWVCFPDAGLLRLRPGSEALASLFPSDAVASLEDRIAVTVPTPSDPVPVAAIVVPRIAEDAARIEWSRRRGTNALMAIIQHPRMASLQSDELAPGLFQFASALVASVPVWNVVVPRVPITADFAVMLHDEVSTLLGLR